MTRIGVIRSHVDGVGSDGHGCGEIDLLPPCAGLVSECSGGQPGSCARPEIGYMGTRIGARLVEADTGNKAGRIRTELGAQLCGDIGTSVNHAGDGGCRPDGGTGCLLLRLSGNGFAGGTCCALVVGNCEGCGKGPRGGVGVAGGLAGGGAAITEVPEVGSHGAIGIGGSGAVKSDCQWRRSCYRCGAGCSRRGFIGSSSSACSGTSCDHNRGAGGIGQAGAVGDGEFCCIGSGGGEGVRSGCSGRGW